jgi:hypothetical protein
LPPDTALTLDASKPGPDATLPKPDSKLKPDAVPMKPDLYLKPDAVLIKPDSFCPTAGQLCNDANACTKGDKIQASTCACAGVPYTCVNADGCHVSFCGGELGCQVHLVANYCFIKDAMGVPQCRKKDSRGLPGACRICDPDQSTTSWSITPWVIQQGALCPQAISKPGGYPGLLCLAFPGSACAPGLDCITLTSACPNRCQCACAVDSDCVGVSKTEKCASSATYKRCI